MAQETEYLLVDEVAALARIPKATLYQYRYQGRGPRAYRVGRRLLYRRADVVAWIEGEPTEPRQAS